MLWILQKAHTSFPEIAEPLIIHTKKYAIFRWTDECPVPFDFLKDSMTTVPLLVYPHTNEPNILYTDADANDSCIGACLTQKTDENDKRPHELCGTQTR